MSTIHISSLFVICEADTKVKLYKMLCYPHFNTRDWSSDYLFLLNSNTKLTVSSFSSPCKIGLVKLQLCSCKFAAVFS